MQDKITIADAPDCLNTNDKAMWVLGYQAALAARSTCLHQIQEPAAAEQAAWHAGLDEGRAQAAPAAVAVADAEYGATEFGWTFASIQLEEGDKRLMAMLVNALGSDHPAIGDLDALIRRSRLGRAALAATPAAAARLSRAEAAITIRNLKREIAEKEAAAPVVLPEPEHDDAYTRRVIEALHENGDPVSVDAAEEMERLRALLATATGLPAQAVAAPTAQDSCCAWSVWWTHDKAKHTTTRQASIAAWDAGIAYALERTTPQAQADARDAAFEAVRKAFCKLQRYSFFLDEKGNVRRTPDYCGNWVEFEAVHTLFEPAAVDAAIAAQAAQGGEA